MAEHSKCSGSVNSNLILDKVVESALPERVNYLREGRSIAVSSSLGCVQGESTDDPFSANLIIEEPDALVVHVPICGGPGQVIDWSARPAA